MLRETVRYVGEPVAVVVADDPYRLADAMERVQVEYKPLPALVTPEGALASAERLHEDWPDNAAVMVRGAVGDAERALAGADVVVNRETASRATGGGVHRAARRIGLSRS